MISIVILTRGEELAIGGVIRNVCQSVKRIPRKSCADFEIIVVDDSDDYETITSAEKELSRLEKVRSKLLHREASERNGLSGAILLGLRTATNQLVIVMDGDGQHPAELIPAFAEALERHSLVFGSRYLSPGGDEGLSNGLRRVASRVFSRYLVRALGPQVRCTDPLSGYFAVDKSRISIPPDALGGWKAGYLTLVHNLLNPAADLSYGELPFKLQPRAAGHSKLSFLTSLQVIRELRATNRMML